MATFDAARARAVAIELKEETVTLYANLLSIFKACQGWTLNGLDPALPTPLELRTQIAAYRALTLPALKLSAWGEEFLTAGVDDTLEYPNPPVYFDGGLTFDGGGNPEGDPTP